jgi:amino acid adenylation domain-containing protein
MSEMEKIAIIGMSGRFPGAKNINEFWENLKNGHDAIRKFSDDELLASGVPHSLIDNPRYVKNRCVLDNVDYFDASFFGFTPRESEYTDPQHRLFLECTWEALESAGYDPDAYSGSIGVFAGCGMNQYILQNVITNQRMAKLISERQLQVFSDKDFLSTRVSYKLNLKGPSFDIQTACSTSLVAVHVACQNLLDYQCDMALSGGAYIHLPRVGGFLHSDGDMRSPDGYCRAFDANANGTVFGDGVGVVVLKRLQDALNDRDTIFAVIGGSAVNNDGANKVGFSAPSVDGQASVISMAHMMADVHPDSISYIEAHGTGTSIGDPIEVKALTKAFRSHTDKKQYCAIGSIKTNIGHLDAASGVTGLIKTALCLYNRQIPPSLNYSQPNPDLKIETSPFYVNTELVDWNTDHPPRRAGVSSFGVGGTNAHVIVEEAPDTSSHDNHQEGWRMLSVSARTESALDQATDRLQAFFERNPQSNLADAAYTLHAGRRHFDFRRTVVCNSSEDAVSTLMNRSPNFINTGKVLSGQRSPVFLFTGQGSQYVGMASELYRTEQHFRETIDYCAEVLLPEMRLDLRELIFNQEDENNSVKINQTNIAQPALFIIEYALAKLWQQYGVVPKFMIGHSIGEYVAACISEVFSLDEALKLVAARGALMQQQPTGTMLSIALSEDAVESYLDQDIELSVVNSPNASVVSGENDKIDLLEKRLAEDNVRCLRLHTSHAFHSKMMEPIMAPFRSLFANMRLNHPKIPFISNLTGDWIAPEQATNPEYWADHLRHAVRFSDGVIKLLNQPGHYFLEVGPGNTLSTLVRQVATHLGNSEQDLADLSIIQSLRHPKQSFSDRAFFLQSISKLWQIGENINLNNLYEGEERRRIPLPTYPFEHQSYWIDPDTAFDHERRSSFEEGSTSISSLDADDTEEREAADVLQSEIVGEAHQKTQNFIADIWRDLLGIDNISKDSNFFELGGDSVCASQVLMRLSDQMGIILSLGDLFENPTLADISKLVASHSGLVDGTMDFKMEHIPREKHLLLSRGQKRLWFLSKLEPDSPAFNLALGIRVEGRLDIDILKKSINSVIERHESLRTTFVDEDGEGRALINDHKEVNLEYIDANKIEGGEKAAFNKIKKATAIPFDLESGPLTRWYLLHLADDVHVLVYNVHHIVFDGWSLGVVLKEIGLFYDAYDQNKEPELPELNIQYVDCAVWLEKWLKSNKLEPQIAYWTDQLKGQLPVLELPFDRPRPQIPSYSGSLESFELPPTLSEKIKSLSKNEESTYFMLFLAAFKILLFRYSGQNDIIVGTPVANRNHIEMEKIVGFFINMLALRSDLSGNPTFQEFLKQIRKTSVDAFANQDLPFEKLVDILKPSRDLSIHPVYQVMFAFHNFSFPPVKLSHIKMQNTMIDRGASQLDLWLSLWKEGPGFKGMIEYSSELFDQSAISQMINNYVTLLESIVEDPQLGIENYQLLDDQERERILYDFNRTQMQLPEVPCFHNLIEERAKQTPDKIAIVFEGQELTYGELNERTNQLAHYLIELGVGPDVLVGVYTERSFEMMIGVLGILKAGGAYVPLDPTYPEERIGFMIEDAKMPVILTQDKLETSIPENKAVTICLDVDWNEIAQQGKDTPHNDVSGDNLAYVIFTSGSTGRPKGVQVPHHAVVNFLVSMAKEPGFTVDDILLAVTTLSFDIHVLELYLPLIVGNRVVIVSREAASDGEQLIKALEESKSTIMQATPSTWRLMIEAGWEGSPDLKALCGGEAFPRDLVKELLSRVGSVWNMYGPTETTVWSSCYQITDADAPILIGHPIANTEIYILDNMMNPVPIGVSGELHIGGDGVTRGYLDRPELTDKQFVPDPFRSEENARIYKTGDLARIRSDGNLEYVARIGTQVKVRGFRIELGEIESIMSEHPSVEKSVATVNEIAPGDVCIIGYVVSQPNDGLDIAALRNYLRTKLPDYMIPQHFMTLDSFPLTPAGKVDRKNLPVPERDRSSLEKAYVSPSNDLEKTITVIWQDVLKLDKIGIEDNFFDLGGHSLRLAQVHRDLRKKISAGVTMLELFRYPTISSLADFLSKDGTEQKNKNNIDDRTAVLQAGKNRLKRLFKIRK